jgi:hypothetical protein
MKKTKLFALIWAILSLISCQKDINIDFSASHKEAVFIEGMLYPNKKPQVFMSQSNPFFSPKVTPQQIFARGAVVTITSGSTVDVLVADSIFNTFRCRWEPFYQGNILAEKGKTYTLDIRFEGKNYTASTTINQKAAVIEKIEYTPNFIDVYGSHDGVIIDLTDHAGTSDYYRFQMNRLIDTSVHHAHVLDIFVNTCAKKGELFPVKDIGRIVFTDEGADGQKMKIPIEVAFEYNKGDEGWIFLQALDKNSAEFYRDLDDQLQAIQNPFVEPVFIKTKIKGAIGVFGSAVLSDSVRFVYPRKNP